MGNLISHEDVVWTYPEIKEKREEMMKGDMAQEAARISFEVRHHHTNTWSFDPDNFVMANISCFTAGEAGVANTVKKELSDLEYPPETKVQCWRRPGDSNMCACRVTVLRTLLENKSINQNGKTEEKNGSSSSL